MAARRCQYFSLFKVFCVIHIAFVATWIFFILPLSSNNREGTLLENGRNKNNLQSSNYCCSSGDATSRIAYMNVKSKGRLGNNMFQYASLLGISRRNGHVPVLDGYKSDLLHQFFQISHVRDLLITNTTTFRENKTGVFDYSSSSLNPAKNWTLDGYFQSWKYFCDIDKEIRHEFTFRDIIKRRAFDILSNFTGRTLVGVHVRRDDMLLTRQKIKGYNAADESYVKKAMTFFREIYTNVQFILCSDGIKWCKRMIKSSDVYFVEHNPAEVDLAVLSLCNHSIITSGTFGWWGAWLAGGTTVYFRDYPRKGSWLRSQYSDSDYYPTAWVPLE